MRHLALLLILTIALAAFSSGGTERVSVTPPKSLVSKGATWRYLDDGSDQGSAWQTLDFDDSAWDSGPAPLGYGDGDEATRVSFGPGPDGNHVTTYFRREFQVSDSSAIPALTLSLLRDDGAIVYLNGTEIARSNMPAGPVDHLTMASSTVLGLDEERFRHSPIDPTLLLPGGNVLAVEIHQSSNNSSDISFDLELVSGPVIERGPYLQLGTPTSAILRWRTSVPTGTAVWLGTSADSLSLSSINGVPKKEHIAELIGLTPDTEYFYAIGDGNNPLVGADALHGFRTSPARGTSKPTRIWVLGDSGTANRSAAAVRDAFLEFTGDRRPDVWLMLGDNAYNSGTDTEFQFAVFEMYRMVMRNTFLWPAYGNHDAGAADTSTQSGVYYDIFSLPRDGEAGGLPSGTEAYYSFDHGDIHFICLNSHDSNRSMSGSMMRWLEEDLAATSARWILAYWHHAPYSKKIDSDVDRRAIEMRENALPILEAGGVDVVLSGHSHVYERSFLLDGHYDLSDTLTPNLLLDKGDGNELGDGVYVKQTAGHASHEGAIYVVAGTSGKVSGTSGEHPAMHLTLETLGSMVLDIDGNRLDARFLDNRGEVRDTFTLLKGMERSLTRGEPRVSLSTGGTQNLFLDAGVENAGMFYQVAGSLGTSPGFELGSIHVPLNRDPWFAVSLLTSNSAVYQNTGGVLDDNGRSQAAIVVPILNDPSLIGLVLHHAFVTHDGTRILMASNPVKLTLTQ